MINHDSAFFKKLVIFGFSAAGKSTLRNLLEGSSFDKQYLPLNESKT